MSYLQSSGPVLRFTNPRENKYLILVVVEHVVVIIIRYLFMQNKMQLTIVEKMIKNVNMKYIFGDMVKMVILRVHIVVMVVQN